MKQRRRLLTVAVILTLSIITISWIGKRKGRDDVLYATLNESKSTPEQPIRNSSTSDSTRIEQHQNRHLNSHPHPHPHYQRPEKPQIKFDTYFSWNDSNGENIVSNSIKYSFQWPRPYVNGKPISKIPEMVRLQYFQHTFPTYACPSLDRVGGFGPSGRYLCAPRSLLNHKSHILIMSPSPDLKFETHISTLSQGSNIIILGPQPGPSLYPHGFQFVHDINSTLKISRYNVLKIKWTGWKETDFELISLSDQVIVETELDLRHDTILSHFFEFLDRMIQELGFLLIYREWAWEEQAGYWYFTFMHNRCLDLIGNGYGDSLESASRMADLTSWLDLLQLWDMNEKNVFEKRFYRLFVQIFRCRKIQTFGDITDALKYFMDVCLDVLPMNDVLRYKGLYYSSRDMRRSSVENALSAISSVSTSTWLLPSFSHKTTFLSTLAKTLSTHHIVKLDFAENADYGHLLFHLNDTEWSDIFHSPHLQTSIFHLELNLCGLESPRDKIIRFLERLGRTGFGVYRSRMMFVDEAIGGWGFIPRGMERMCRGQVSLARRL